MSKQVEDVKFSDYPLVVPSLKKLSKKYEAFIKELKECGSAKTAYPVIKKIGKFEEKLQAEVQTIEIRNTLNTQDPVYKKAKGVCDQVLPQIQNYDNEINKILSKAKYRKDLEKILGPFYFKKIDFALKGFDEKIIPELIKDNELCTKYDAVVGGAQIPFRGEILNLSQIGKYTQDVDRATRKEAAEALDKWLGEHDEEIGAIYSEMVANRDAMAKKLGYKSFTELGYINMNRYDYDAKMVANYRKQIEESVVPVCSKLYKVQMKNLGIKNPQYYDYAVSFKSGNPVPAGNTEYLVKAAKKMYHALSEESGEFFDFMIRNELMDLDARPGKRPGGYMCPFDYYKSAFIFANSNGTAGDVDTLTHEGGHAFQGYVAARCIKIPAYRAPTLESCEIHSMSMEFFAWPYAKEFFGKDAEKYKYHHLSDSIEFLPYGISVDEFQHWVYAHPTASHAERCAAWKEIERRLLPERKFDGLPTLNKGTWWLRQSHIFTSPFYYIDYTLAQVCAFQFLLLDQKNHEKAWKKYVKLCKCGGKYPFCELLEKNKLKNPFEDGQVKKIISGCSKILKEFDPSKF